MRKGKKIALAMGVFIFLVVSMEFFARYYLGLGTPPLSIAHPTIEYMFKPNQDVQRFGNRILINEWGMRSLPVTASKSDKTEVRILWFGDSVINGGNLTDHDSLATTLLENYLTEVWSKPVRVLNVSAGSWGPKNMLEYIKEFGNFEADYAIITVSSHDAGDYPTFVDLNENTHPTVRPFSAVTEGIVRYLPRYLPKEKNTPENKIAESEAVHQDSVIAWTAKSLEAYKELQEVLLAKGSKLIVQHHVERQELLDATMLDGYWKLKENTLDSVIWFSDSLMMHNTLSGDKTPYRDNIHVNEYGQRVLFELVREVLQTGNIT